MAFELTPEFHNNVGTDRKSIRLVSNLCGKRRTATLAMKPLLTVGFCTQEKRTDRLAIRHRVASAAHQVGIHYTYE